MVPLPETRAWRKPDATFTPAADLHYFHPGASGEPFMVAGESLLTSAQ